MIHAIKQIGEYTLKQHPDMETDYDIPFDKPKGNEKVIIIQLSSSEDKVFQGIRIEEYSSEKAQKYLYKKASSGNGPDKTPTSKLTEVEKTLLKKVIPSLLKITKGYKSKNNDDSKEFSILEKISNYFDYSEELKKFKESMRNKNELSKDKKKEKIKNKETKLKETVQDRKKEIVDAINNQINKKISCLLTLSIDGKFVGEFDIFKDTIKEESLKNFYSMESIGESKTENKTCYVCNKNKSEVYGFVRTFAFYTVDKPGMVSGGFDQSQAWKNYPVCKECAEVLGLRDRKESICIEKNRRIKNRRYVGEREWNFRWIVGGVAG